MREGYARGERQSSLTNKNKETAARCAQFISVMLVLRYAVELHIYECNHKLPHTLYANLNVDLIVVGILVTLPSTLVVTHMV